MPSVETAPSTKATAESVFRSREKELPRHAWLRLPTTLYARLKDAKQNPKSVGVESIRLGIMADRNFVYQRVGGILPLRLNVSDFPAYPSPPGKTSELFSVDSEMIKMISERTHLLSGNRYGVVAEGDVQDWFLRAVTFRQRFMESPETRELIMISDGTVYSHLSEKGIGQMWESIGFPKIKADSNVLSSQSI